MNLSFGFVCLIYHYHQRRWTCQHRSWILAHLVGNSLVWHLHDCVHAPIDVIMHAVRPHCKQAVDVVQQNWRQSLAYSFSCAIAAAWYAVMELVVLSLNYDLQIIKRRHCFLFFRFPIFRLNMKIKFRFCANSPYRSTFNHLEADVLRYRFHENN